MRVAGIIAEYDPLHNGHAWQLSQARALGAETIVVALSCGAVQRGGLPLLPDTLRAQAALRAGADLVLALPAWWACSGAECFAAGGVALLAAAGCDTLICGAETPDPSLLGRAAAVLASSAYTNELKARLSGGARSFAAARADAAEAVCPGVGLRALLSRPNDNLAVEYARAIAQQGASLAFCPLPRQGAGHGAPLPSFDESAEEKSFASATALRALWREEGAAALKPYVPSELLPLYEAAEREGRVTDPVRFELALLSRLRGGDAARFAQVREVNEGLEYRLAQAATHCTRADALYDALTTARYPRARMRRLCFYAALNWHKALPMPALPPYLHVLAARREALPLLENAALPAGTSLAKLARHSAFCSETVRRQAEADALFSLCLCAPQPAGGCYTQKPVIF